MTAAPILYPAATAVARAPISIPPSFQTQDHPNRREQVALARQARKGDVAGREAMVLRNRRLVYAIALRYTGRGLDLEDLVQEGILGLIKAVDRFDPERGTAFSTYAVWWIHQSIRRAIERGGRLIRIPSHLAAVSAAVQRAARDLDDGAAKPANPGVIAAAAGIEPDVCTALLRAARTPASVDAPVRQDGDILLGEFLADPASPDPEAIATRHAVQEGVNRLLDLLPDCERTVIRARFGFDGEPETLAQIAERYGLSEERIRQIQASALAGLRRAGHLLRLDVLARESQLL